jgi:hypothetical protein
MTDGDTNLAQAIYLAQLFAARNTCKCKACMLLRKASDDMTDQMLGGAAPGADTKKRFKARVAETNIHTQNVINPGDNE